MLDIQMWRGTCYTYECWFTRQQIRFTHWKSAVQPCCGYGACVRSCTNTFDAISSTASNWNCLRRPQCGLSWWSSWVGSQKVSQSFSTSQSSYQYVPGNRLVYPQYPHPHTYALALTTQTLSEVSYPPVFPGVDRAANGMRDPCQHSWTCILDTYIHVCVCTNHQQQQRRKMCKMCTTKPIPHNQIPQDWLVLQLQDRPNQSSALCFDNIALHW